MLKHFSILSFAIITSIHSASAQATSVNEKINDSFTKTENKQSFILKSKYTSHEYLIQVAVPTTDTPKDGFPVLYLLDGNAAFDSATNIAKSVGAGANKLGLSLGKINYCISALKDIGFVKVKNFTDSNNKLNYLYFLTPLGIKEKTRATLKFLEKKKEEYDILVKSIENLNIEKNKNE